MFNRKKLRDLSRRMYVLEDALFVYNYFHECPCCRTEERILKSEARTFEKLISSMSFGLHEKSTGYAQMNYTTKQGYKNHKPAIDEWAKQVKEFKNK